METQASEIYQQRKAAELKTYSENINVHDLPAIFHYWSHKFLKPKCDALGIRGVNEMFEDWMMIAYQRGGSERAAFCSIGSGNCDVEIALAAALRRRGLSNFTIECLELNTNMLQRGRDAAAAAGLSEFMVFSQTDFNSWQPAMKYQAIIANQSLHHVVELETLFSTIRQSLEPYGLFIVNDVIGRNGHMRWPEALELVHQFWREMPDDYKYNLLLKRAEPLYENWDCSTEGFEGIRAQDVLPLLLQTFDFELFLGFGNLIDIFIDRCFGHHFSEDREWDRDFIDRVALMDDQLISEGKLSPTHIIAVMSTGVPESQKFWRDIPPDRMVRSRS